MGVDCGGKALGNERARIMKLTVADFLLFHSFFFFFLGFCGLILHL